MTKFCLLAIAAMLVARPALAEDHPTFDIAASVRLRYETIAGQARVGRPADEQLINLRTIIQSSYHHGPLTLGLDLWDSRVLAADRTSSISTNEINGIEPVQAFIAYQIGDAETAPVNAKITAGRMVLDINSARLVANDDYRNTTRTFTGLRAELHGPDAWSATLIYVLPNQALPDDFEGLRTGRVVVDHVGFDTRLWGGFVKGENLIGPVSLDLTALRLEERDRPDRATRDRQLTTFGGRLFAAPQMSSVDLDVELLHQTGTTRTSLAVDAPQLPVSAWFLHAESGFSFHQRWRPRLAVEFDYGSGNDANTPGNFTRFDTLFGQRRRDFSPSGLLSSIARTNMVSLGGRLDLAPSRRLDGFVSVRKIWLASATDAFAATGVIDPTGRSGADAGWEIDSRLRWWLVPGRLQFEGDFIWLAKGRFLATAPNRNVTGDTRYLSLNMSAFF